RARAGGQAHILRHGCRRLPGKPEADRRRLPRGLRSPLSGDEPVRGQGPVRPGGDGRDRVPGCPGFFASRAPRNRQGGSAIGAARWLDGEDVGVVNIPEPSAGPGQAILRVGSCGICGTDVDEYRHGPVLIPTDQPHPLTGRVAPLTLGHEFWGTVVEVGPDVTNLRQRDRVAPEVCLACGSCAYCRGGEPARCRFWATLGLHADGGLAEYVAVPAGARGPAPRPVGGGGGGPGRAPAKPGRGWRRERAPGPA